MLDISTARTEIITFKKKKKMGICGTRRGLIFRVNFVKPFMEGTRSHLRRFGAFTLVGARPMSSSRPLCTDVQRDGDTKF